MASVAGTSVAAWVCALLLPAIASLAGEDLTKHANELADLMLRSKADPSNLQWKMLHAASDEELAQSIPHTQGLPQWILKAIRGARACTELAAIFAQPDRVPHDWDSKPVIEARQEKALTLYAKPEYLDWWHYGLLMYGYPNFYLRGVGQIARPDSLPLLEGCYKWKTPNLNSTQIVASRRRVIAETIGRYHTRPALEVLFRLWLDPVYSEAEKETLIAIVADNPAWAPACAAFAENRSDDAVAFANRIEDARVTRGRSAAAASPLCLRIASLQSSLKPLTPDEAKELSASIEQLRKVPEYALKQLAEDPAKKGLSNLIAWAELGSRESELTEVLQTRRMRGKPADIKNFSLMYAGRNHAWWAHGLMFSEDARDIQFYLTGMSTRPVPQILDVLEHVYTWKALREAEAGREIPVHRFLIDTALKSSPEDCLDLFARFWRSPSSTESEKKELAAAIIKLEAGFRYEVEHTIFALGKARPGVPEFLTFVESQRIAPPQKP